MAESFSVKESQTENHKEISISLEDFFERHKKQLFFSSMIILGNRHDAEDAVQDVFLLAYKFLKKKPIEITKAWMAKIMLNHCSQLVKKGKRYKVVELETMDAKANQYTSESFESLAIDELAIWEVLNKLDLYEKTLIILRYVHDLKISDISSVTNIKEGTVKSQISRTLSKVRAMLEQEGKGYGSKSR